MRAVLREPLVHFIALGALLFLYFDWTGGGSGTGSTRIVVTPGLVEHLASGFARTWQRPPTNEELKDLIDEHVKEEIATREAAALGLDRDDTVIRRRLRQKMEFLVEDALEQGSPTDAELQEWLEKHPEAFRVESRVALRQVYFSAERRGASARAEVERLLARLRAAGPEARIDVLGDSSLLPVELPLGPLSEVARAFGTAFAGQVETLEPGQWTGPVESPYGLHLVLVVERQAPTSPELADVRPLVEGELQAERRRARLVAHYERLLEKYTVTIEMPKQEKKHEAAAGPESARR